MTKQAKTSKTFVDEIRCILGNTGRVWAKALRRTRWSGGARDKYQFTVDKNRFIKKKHFH